MKQLSKFLSGTFIITRENSDVDVRIYKIQKPNEVFWIAWLSPDYLILPEDSKLEKSIVLSFVPQGAVITNMAINADNPSKTTISSSNGQTKLILTTAPIFVSAK